MKPLRALAALGALCAIAGAGFAQDSTSPAAAAVPAATLDVDALWAQAPDNSNLSVCQDPTAPASAGCFGSGSLIPLPEQTSGNYPPATDGTNVYLGSQPGYSCPAADFGLSCTKTQIGWGGFIPTTIAASGGTTWIGSGTGGASSGIIYSCPSDLAYTGSNSVPSECVELDDAGNRDIEALVYANETLYAGLSKDGYIWSCNPDKSGCDVLAQLPVGKVGITSLAVGSGYVWAGLGNDEIWRCDAVTTNSCQLWDTAAKYPSIESLADDGEGTLWAATCCDGTGVPSEGDVVWACPEASPNSCSTVISEVYAHQVTAGAGNGFSSFTNGSMYATVAWGAFQYSASEDWAPSYPQILYVPADGPTAYGGVRVWLKAPRAVLAGVCSRRGSLRTSVEVKGAHRVRALRRLDLCAGRNRSRIAVRRFDLLYEGKYSIRVRSARFSGRSRVSVVGSSTAPRSVRLHTLKRYPPAG